MSWDDAPPDSGLPVQAGGSWDSMPPDQQGLSGGLPQTDTLGAIRNAIAKNKINTQAPTNADMIVKALMALGVSPQTSQVVDTAYDQTVGKAPWNVVSNAMPQIAGNAAERMGEGVNVPGIGNVSVPPKVAASTMFPLAMLPQLVQAASLFGTPKEILDSGSRIGEAEKAAGVITRAPDKLPTSGNVGETLNTLEGQLDASLKGTETPESFAQKFGGTNHMKGFFQDAAEMYQKDPEAAKQYIESVITNNTNNGKKIGGWFPDNQTANMFEQELQNELAKHFPAGTINGPQTARDAVATARYINSNPNLVGKSPEILVQAQRVGSKAQTLLNQLVPGREAAAADYATLKKLQAPITMLKQLAGYPVDHPVKSATTLYALKLLKDMMSKSNP